MEHHGTIQAVSQPGAGTTFTIHLSAVKETHLAGDENAYKASNSYNK